MALAEGELEALSALPTLDPPQLSMEDATAPPKYPWAGSTAYQKMISASSGAILTSLLVTPFDVVKTRMQTGVMDHPPPPSTPPASTASVNTSIHHRTGEGGHAKGVGWARVGGAGGVAGIGGASGIGSATRINGTWDGVIKIVRYEGLSSLWRGLSPTLIMSIPSTVIYYTGYEHIRDLISAHLKSQNQDQWAPLLAGATARTLAATAISPIELLRTRMQSTSSLRTLSSALTNIRAMVRDAGWIALWRGLTPTLWRDVPFSAVYWIGYEGGKKWLDGLDGGSSPSGISETGGPWSGNPPFTTAPQSPTTPTHAPVNTYLEFRNAFLAGATSGTLAALITTPFDVAKTLQQAAQHPPSTKHHPISVPSTMEVMRGIVRREGWRGLFRGVSPRIAKVAPACAVMISSYEVGKKIFERSNNHPA